MLKTRDYSLKTMSLKHIILVAFGVVALFGAIYTKKLANDLPIKFPKCHRSDPNINACLKKAATDARPFLRKGIPELNVPSIEPFVVPEVSLETGTDQLNIKAKLSQVAVIGLSEYEVQSLDLDLNELWMRGHALIKNLRLEGDYVLDGKLLLAPVKGKGKFDAAIETSNLKIFHKGKLVKKGNRDYLKAVYTNCTFDVINPKIHFQGLGDGSEEYNKITNKVIEDNVDELFNELKPALEKVVTEIYENLLFKGFEDNVPFDKLLPN